MADEARQLPRQTQPQGARGHRPPAEPRERGPETHLLVKSLRPAGFRRAGIRWDSSPTLVPLESLSNEAIRLIESETMLHSRRVTADEADEHLQTTAKIQQAFSEDITPAQIADAFLRQQAHMRALENEIADLRARLSGADRPPGKNDPIPGQ